MIKRYVEEEGTGLADDLWEKSRGIATSTVAFAEALSAFSRRHREGLLSGREYHTVVEKFKTDYGFLILVPIDDALNHKIETIIKKHPCGASMPYIWLPHLDSQNLRITA